MRRAPTGRPAFMTVAMWFAWLLRDDVRAGAAIGDAEMQREFVVWWILFGRAVFPGAWWYGEAQRDVAMEPVPVDGGAANRATLPRLLRQVHRARPDLAARFPVADAEAAAELLCWYRLSAARALPEAPALPHAALLETERPSRRSPWDAEGTAVPRMAVALHAADPGIAASIDASSRAARQRLADWYAAAGRASLPAPAPLPDWREIVPPPRPARPPLRGSGVNIVGYTRQASGVGEDARMLAAALAAAGIAHTGVNAEGALSPARLRHATTVFCLNPFDTARLFLEHGAALFAGRRTIGAWPWELPDFPAAWGDALGLVDAVWAPSRFVAGAFAAAGARRVRLLPPAVALPPFRPARRGTGGLPDRQVFTFVYPFDPSSFLARKNPLAAVHAFRQAFPSDDPSVALLLRPNGAPTASAAWAEVAAACADDRRIVILPGRLPRARALAILAACDCLVSPHRAEGFGRNIAEAILLGVRVLATFYSGCADFLRPAERIGWSQRVVRPGDYPFGEGSHWAEPDLDDLAGKMRRLAQAGRTLPSRAERSRQRAFAARHDPEAAGRRYAEALARADRPRRR